MHLATTLSAFLASPTHTWNENLQFYLRWFHFLAGITWIGLLYFFNLINVPFMKQVDAAMKPKVFQYTVAHQTRKYGLAPVSTMPVTKGRR